MPLLLSSLAFSCLLSMPVDGPVVAGFAPQGSYGGHWGVDLAVPVGTPVGAAAAGTVTFAGSVGGRRSVTIHHGGGVRTSYSYLDSIAVSVGTRVARGSVVATSGLDNGRPAVHLSLRVGDRYVNPLSTCGGFVPLPGVRLSPSAGPPYPPERAARHPRRHLRSPSSRSSRGG